MTHWWDLWSGREKSSQTSLQKGDCNLQHQLLLKCYVNHAHFPFCKHGALSWTDSSQETGICCLLQAERRGCHMSPSLRHHLILQHAPDATRLPPLRSATHTHNGHFTNAVWHGWCWWQWPGCWWRCWIQAVHCWVTVTVPLLVRNVCPNPYLSECHMSLKLGNKWNQAVEPLVSLPMPNAELLLPQTLSQYLVTG